MPGDPFGLLLNQDGRFEACGCEQFGGKNYLSDARAAAYTPGRLADGKPALLVAKKNFGRALALTGGKLEVVEQYAGGRGVSIMGLHAEGDQVVLLDESRAAARVLERRGAEWSPLQEVDLPAKFGLERVMAVELTGRERSDLLLVGSKGFLLLARDGRAMQSAPEWGYESDAKNPSFRLPVVGDLNHDGARDLTLFDAANRTLEFLTLPAKPGGAPSRALRFELFEEGRITGGPAGGLRAMEAADLTGDGKDDLLVLAHGRILLYVQE
jgi:hypothetical protein